MRKNIFPVISLLLVTIWQHANAQGVDSILTPVLHDRICIEEKFSDPPREKNIWVVDPYLFGVELLRTSFFPKKFLNYVINTTRNMKRRRIKNVILLDQRTVPENLKGNERTKTAYKAAEKIIIELSFYLKGGLPKRIKGFLPHNVRSGTATELLERWLQGTIKIECTIVPGSSLDDSLNIAEKTEEEQGETGAEFTSAFLIRGRVKDLTIPRQDIKNSSSGTIAFKDDRESDEQSFQTNIVVGLDAKIFRAPDSNWKVLPYAHYQLNDNNGNNKEDIHTVTPGLLLSRSVEIGRLIDAELGLAPNATFDFKQSAESARFKGFFTPSLTIGDQVYLGGWKKLAGPIHYRPLVSFLAEGAHVFDNGSSTEIGDNDQYYGFGGSAELKLNIRGLPILRDTIFTFRYWHLELFSAELDHAKRFSAEAAYTLDEKKRFTVSLSFEEGENSESFQREEFVGVNLGAKF